MIKIIAALLLFILAIIKIYIAHKHGLISPNFGLPSDQFKKSERLPYLLFTGLWVLVAAMAAIGVSALLVHGARQAQLGEMPQLVQSDLVAGAMCVLLLGLVVKHGQWLMQKNQA